MIPFSGDNRREKASKTPESALRINLPSKRAQQHMQVRTMSKEKRQCQGSPITETPHYCSWTMPRWKTIQQPGPALTFRWTLWAHWVVLVTVFTRIHQMSWCLPWQNKFPFLFLTVVYLPLGPEVAEDTQILPFLREQTTSCEVERWENPECSHW